MYFFVWRGLLSQRYADKDMRIESNENYIDIEVSLEDDESLPSYGDAYLSIKVHSNGYSGTNDLWVSSNELKDFCISLVKLEKDRKGETNLVSISPNELELKIYSTDSSGHMAVKGTTGYEMANFKHSVAFGFEFDPSQLVRAVNTNWVQQNVA